MLDLSVVPELPASLVDALRKHQRNEGTGECIAYVSTRDSALPDYIKELLEIEPPLRARFNRVPRDAGQFRSDGRPDQSAVDHSLACMLANWGINPADIERTVRASHVARGLPLKSKRYYKRTIGRAVAWTAQKEREREQERKRE